MRRSRGFAIVFPVALAVAVLLLPAAQAAGSGYNLTFTRSAGTVSDPAVDLVAVSSADSGGSRITVSFTVSGHLRLDSSSYGYFVFFGGSSASNASSEVEFSNNSSFGNEISSTGFSPMSYTLSGGGSSLTFKINKTDVGSAGGFRLNAFAWAGSSGSYSSVSYLGSDYSGGGSCTQAGCVNSAVTSALNTFVLIGIIVLVVVVVVVVLVVVLVVRSRKRPPPMMQPGQTYPAPPGQPWTPGPPGGGPPMPPPPPPPPPTS